MRAITARELADLISATEIQARVICTLEHADKRGSHLNTRLVATRAFPDDASGAAIVATRAALRSLERRGIVRRLVQGEGRGQSIWALVPAYVSEGSNGRRSLFFNQGAK